MTIKKGIATALIATAGGFAALGISAIFSPKYNSLSDNAVNQPVYRFTNSQTSGSALDFTVAAEKSVHAVVHVKTKMGGYGSQPTMYDFFFGNPNGTRMFPSEASGSGVIISGDGYIVTNNHVIDKATEIEVVTNDGRSFKAELIGKDPTTDIALLKIEADDLPTISYGNSDDLKVGEWVLAVGNPFNLTSTVTAGIVSAKGRNLNLLQENYAIESFIQTDAAVNPGNSGGALVNANGELVGINTAIASQTGSYAGYSFAVPVSIVRKIVADLSEFGTVQRAMLGVSLREVDGKLADELNIDKPQGVLVHAVNDGSSAEDAGIEANDLILKINNIAVNKIPQLQEQISKYRPGDKIEVELQRDGKLKNISVTLKNSLGTISYVNKAVIDVLGASFGEIDKSVKQKLGLTNGVQVSEIGAGKLLRAGVQEGFIILNVNRIRVNSADDIQNVLNKSKGGIYIEGIYPDGTTGYYAFGIE